MRRPAAWGEPPGVDESDNWLPLSFDSNVSVNSLRFDEVVFMDDFFRSVDNGLTSHSANRRFLRAFVEPAFRRVGTSIREIFAKTDGGSIPVGALMQRLGLEQSPQGWAAAGSCDLDEALAAVSPLNIGGRTLVIGWGLPPSMLKHIDAQGGKFIDVEIDPLRFSRHLYLCVRSNDDQIQRVLESLVISQETFWSAAAAVKGRFARLGSPSLFGPQIGVGLFAGQTEVDLALVHDGQLVAPEDHLQTIAQWAADVDVLLIKRHPYSGNNGLLDSVIRSIPNAMLVEHNIYGLLSSDNLRFVGALSSGVIQEAAYFGVEGRALLLPDRNNAEILPRSCSRWFSVSADVGNYSSVAQMCRVTPLWQRWLGRKAVERSFSPDALDTAFGFRWGLDANSSSMPQMASLKVGTTYSFARGSEASSWLQAGWHIPEDWGVWSGAAECRLALPLACDFPSDGDLKLALIGLLYGDATIESVKINDRHCDYAREDASGSTVLSISFDAKKFSALRVASVSIHVIGSVRPSDVGDSQDMRLLGFGLTSLTVVSVASAFSEESDGEVVDSQSIGRSH